MSAKQQTKHTTDSARHKSTGEDNHDSINGDSSTISATEAHDVAEAERTAEGDTDKSAESANAAGLNSLATRPVGALLWQYSVPAVAGMVVVSLYNVIDRIFIGRGVGPDAISGLAITFPLMNLATALGVLVGAGARHVYP